MQPFYLGIDVSKGYADFALLDARANVVEEPFQLDDTAAGHDRLSRLIAEFLKEHSQAEIFAAVESTGGYENNWFALLRRLGNTHRLHVARVNPLRVNRNTESRGTRSKTDAISAVEVAAYLKAHGDRVRFDVDDQMETLRSYWNFLSGLVDHRVQLLNQLESVLYRAHPELVSKLTGSAPQWLLKLLQQYPTARRLARARTSTVARIRYITESRAAELVGQARNSVAAQTDEPTEWLVKGLCGQILQLDKSIRDHKESIFKRLDLPEELELLKSFGSIGDYSAVGILLEIGEVKRFETAKHMAAYFGVHPTLRQSGDGKMVSRMSKRGSATMRRLLYMIALHAAHSDHPVLAPLYERLTRNGMPKLAALGVCMHKTLRILFGILDSGRPFDPNIEHAHRERRAQAPQDRRRINKKRRYQQYDTVAPISKRAERKRRQQSGSHGGSATTNGMSASTVAERTDRL